MLKPQIIQGFKYLSTIARFKPSQIAVFSKLGINDYGVTGKAKAK
ncbi:MAG: hypothetical protein O2932_03485 [Actinomycetota bacterium]|nr:hypothetical protein [Actinomycetota bacterium]